MRGVIPPSLPNKREGDKRGRGEEKYQTIHKIGLVMLLFFISEGIPYTSNVIMKNAKKITKGTSENKSMFTLESGNGNKTDAQMFFFQLKLKNNVSKS